MKAEAQENAALALDTGTTSIKAGLMDGRGVLRHVVAHDAPKISVRKGRYESDAMAYAELADRAVQESRAQAGACTTLGLCSQRSSFLVWEKSTGQAVTPLISWQDSRGAASCEELRRHEAAILGLTGLPLAPYYFAPKLRTLIQGHRDCLARLVRGELLVGTLDTFLIWRWSGGRFFVTDASMAARTLLMDVGTLAWSPLLCDLFGIPLQILPQIRTSTGMDLRLDNGLTLVASMADQSAALYASVRETSAEALVNLGTGCFVVRNTPTGSKRAKALEGYLHSLVYQDRGFRPHFAIEGTLNSIASALASYPVRDCHSEELAKDDIFCLAEPSGLGAPYFRKDLGLHFSGPVSHLPQSHRAVLVLEAVVFRVARILEDFDRESALKSVYLSGGLSELSCLHDGIARCVPFSVFRLQERESSLLGAAMLAAGRMQASARNSKRLSASSQSKALQEKYERWKAWLDALLGQS